MVKNNYKLGAEYSAAYITNGKYHGIYDSYIAIINGNLEYLTDWIDAEHKELCDEYGCIDEHELYEQALDNVIDSIADAYDTNKNIYVFKGIAPNKAFDVYSEYTCIKVI